MLTTTRFHHVYFCTLASRILSDMSSLCILLKSSANLCKGNGTEITWPQTATLHDLAQQASFPGPCPAFHCLQHIERKARWRVEKESIMDWWAMTLDKPGPSNSVFPPSLKTHPWTRLLGCFVRYLVLHRPEVRKASYLFTDCRELVEELCCIHDELVQEHQSVLVVQSRDLQVRGTASDLWLPWS